MYRIMFLLPITYTKTIFNREKGSCRKDTCRCRSVARSMKIRMDDVPYVLKKNVIYGAQIGMINLYIEHILYKYPIQKKILGHFPAYIVTLFGSNILFNANTSPVK